MFSCFQNQNHPNPELYDLTRILSQAKINNFHFNPNQELLDHWKKNPNRYSKLSHSEKWLSLQMTFQEDPKVFRNVSKESIFFTPNMEIEWKFPSSKYMFYFSLAKMKAQDTEGHLEIFTGGTQVSKINFSEIPNQIWKDFFIKIDIKDKLKLRWATKSGYLFLGNPMLIKKEISKPNVILIVIDAMRRETLGCLNQNWSVTPNLDELCKHSLLFMNHYSNANWTKPSMISLFFGEYASNLGITNPGFSVYDYEKEIFYKHAQNGIVNLLRKQNYFTQSIMNNVFLLEYTGVGVDLGFHSIEQIGKDFYDTEEITKASVKFLNSRFKEIPFFLHINYNTPHGPYEPPQESLRQVEEILKEKNLSPIYKKYLAEIYYTDLQIGKIVQELKKLNQLQDTWILITSDHGEMFSSHHTFEKNGITGTLYGHGQTLYEEELAIPFFIYVPEKFRNKIINWTWKKPSSNVSILPTLLSLLEIENPLKTKGFDYTRFFVLNENDSNFQNQEKMIYMEGRMMESILDYPYKYIRYFPGYTNQQLQGVIPPESRLEEIYNIEQDKDEKKNLITNYELLQTMRQTYKKNRLTKNTFHLVLPSNKKYVGNFFTRGEIYWIEAIGNMSYKIINRFQVQFQTQPFEKSELVIYTSYPLLEYSLNFENHPKQYKIGKWQIPSGEEREKEFEFLQSHFSLEPIFHDQPLLYNIPRLSGNTYFVKEKSMSNEVKNILKSWGYIHE